MMKKVICLATALLLSVQMYSGVFAKAHSSSNPVRVAVKKYKIGNYTGCLQDCQTILSHDPSNAVAYYYMAMSYAQAGHKNEAINAYARVLSLRPNAKLQEYAATGRRCIETPDKCHPPKPVQKDDSSELDRFIASPSNLSPNVRVDFEKKHLETVKNQMNNGKDLDSYQLNRLNDNSANDNKTTAQKMPTNDEIVAALKVLNSAGMNPYSKANLQAQAMSQVQNQVSQNASQMDSGYQSADASQLSALLGDGSLKKSNNNAMMNMLPYMMAQNKDGSGNYSPQLMQSMIMNSMMTDFNFDTDNNKNN